MEKREREEKSGKRGFDFEELTVYQIAREVLRRLAGWAARPPRKAASVADHLDRALDSVLLNIAEGAGKEAGSKDRARFYRIALGSAKEAASALDILAIRGFIPQARAEEARDGLLRVSPHNEQDGGLWRRQLQAQRFFFGFSEYSAWTNSFQAASKAKGDSSSAACRASRVDCFCLMPFASGPNLPGCFFRMKST